MQLQRQPEIHPRALLEVTSPQPSPRRLVSEVSHLQSGIQIQRLVVHSPSRSFVDTRVLDGHSNLHRYIRRWIRRAPFAAIDSVLTNRSQLARALRARHMHGGRLGVARLLVGSLPSAADFHNRLAYGFFLSIRYLGPGSPGAGRTLDFHSSRNYSGHVLALV